MKKVVTHTKMCQRKVNGGCPVCKQLIALCCYHTKHCTETNECQVPFCWSLKQQQILYHRQQVLCRLRLGKNSGSTPQGKPSTPAVLLDSNNVSMGTGGSINVPSVVPGDVSSANSMNVMDLSDAGMAGLQSQHQTFVGIKLGTQTPPASVMQTVKQEQKEGGEAIGVGHSNMKPGAGFHGQNVPLLEMHTLGHVGPNQGSNLQLELQSKQKHNGSTTDADNVSGAVGGKSPQ